MERYTDEQRRRLGAWVRLARLRAGYRFFFGVSGVGFAVGLELGDAATWLLEVVSAFLAAGLSSPPMLIMPITTISTKIPTTPRHPILSIFMPSDPTPPAPAMDRVSRGGCASLQAERRGEAEGRVGGRGRRDLRVGEQVAVGVNSGFDGLMPEPGLHDMNGNAVGQKM